jgi:cytochrome c oxidase cbb3-type subunit III
MLVTTDKMPRNLSSLLVTTPRFVALFLFLGVNTALAAQQVNPFAGDAKASKAGEFQFRINCAFCHGLGARGGGRGPDLTRARKRHGTSDADMFHSIKEGVPGTAMPAAVGSIGVVMTNEEVWQVVAYLRSVQVKAPEQSGNSRHGSELFHGDANCSGCHMVEGKGGRLGPDLTGVGGARAVDYIVDSIRNPSRRLAQGLSEPTKEFPQEYETVTAVTSDGKEITGVTLNEDSFSVQLMDTGEHIYLLEKDKLRSFKKTRVSLMPAYTTALLSDKDLQDIVAYLLSLGAK